MTVLEIVKQYLVEHGFDGLCDGDDGEPCGCSVDDLCPCGEYFGECIPAIRRKATKEEAEHAGCGEGDELYFRTEMTASEPTRAEMLEFIDGLIENVDDYCFIWLGVEEDVADTILNAIRKLIEESK